ncbi:MAG: aminotransferase class I/II-fold pyridoxal phosphate-dependent enzyme [Rubrivivax sp.]
MGPNEERYVHDAFATNWLSTVGPNLELFEKAFSEKVGGLPCVALASGTAALHLALRLVGVGPGDEVITPTLTFVASANAVSYLGAKNVFIDSDRTSWNMDPVLLANALDERAAKGKLPKAVVVVHLYGQSADLDPILASCKKHGVPLIEDAAEAMGTLYKGKQVGQLGEIGIFSFNGNKIITTSGGGMLSAHDPARVQKARFWSQQAREPGIAYEHVEMGFNYRMSNVLAGIGRGQLEVLEERVAARRRLAFRYRDAFADLAGLTLTPQAPFGLHTNWLSVFLVDERAFGASRDDIIAALERENIESRPVWKPMHLQPLYADSPRIGGAVAEDLFRRGILPAELEQHDRRGSGPRHRARPRRLPRPKDLSKHGERRMRDVVVRYRRAFVVAVHLALWTLAYLCAFLLRFEFDIPRGYFRDAPLMLVTLLVFRTAVHWRFGLFHGLWRYSGMKDLLDLVKAVSLSTVLFVVALVFIVHDAFPRTVILLDWLLSIMFVGGLRFSIRTVREVAVQNAPPKSGETKKRILVLGAGDAGEMLMRDIQRSYARKYEPVGFLDDSVSKQNASIHGVPVLGTLARTTEIAQRERVDEIILAIPSLRGRELRKLVEICRPTGATIRTLPDVGSLIDGEVTVNQLHEVKIEDLLGREPVTLDTQAIGDFLHDQIVLVTGAGGSIGSELCRQICRFGPKRILLVDQAENALFLVDRAVKAEFPEVTSIPYLADICDTRRLENIFQRETPDVVFHAAAHKHVPMMEANSGEAIKNNVFGTKKVADVADRYRVKTFVMVSTDKAVNPTSVMGVSKRVAEIYVQALSQRSKTHYVTVRFGNVLGSAGSVVPLFKEQIAKGGPVTVTHPEMTRYFMTIPEACQLILQAGTMGKGGEIFILDMGQPVKIVDLARDLIRLSGLRPDEDIEIAFSGIRPGEKLFEELSSSAENASKTRHPKIFVGTFKPYDWDRVAAGYQALHECSDGADQERLRLTFQDLVPEYQLDAPLSLSPPPVSEPASDEVSLPLGERASAPAV